MNTKQAIDILETMTAEPDEGQEARLDADELDAVLYAVKILKGEEKQNGHDWTLKNDADYLGGGYTKCTNCGMKYAWGAYHEVFEFAFCPTCGAPMNTNSTIYIGGKI